MLSLCTVCRHAEAEHEKETKELQECWSELSQTIQQVYHMHNADDLTLERLDVLKMKQLVLRSTFVNFLLDIDLIIAWIWCTIS